MKSLQIVVRRTFQKKFLLPSVARLTVAIFTFTNIGFAHQPQTTVWKERKESFQLASLPSGLPLSPNRPALLKQQLLNASPLIQSALANKESDKKLVASRRPSAVSALPDRFFSYVNLRAAASFGGRRPDLIVIEDVHQNHEAQLNISNALLTLAAFRKGPLTIGLEGANGPFVFQSLKTFPDPAILKETADAFLASGEISGPAHAGFSGVDAAMIGVDDPALYRANVASYKRASLLKPSVLKKLSDLEKELAARKERTFTPELRAFDAVVQAHRAGTLPYGDYLKQLHARSTDGETSIAVEAFLAAYQMEQALDLKRVEAERRQALETLVPSLSESDVRSLLSAGSGYQEGRLTFADYYAHLKNLCERRGLDLRRYPAFDNYIRYVLLSDGISAEKLFTEVAELESAAYAALARTPAQAEIVARSNQLYLAGQLAQFALTSQQWADYAAGRDSLDLDLSAFETFYVAAEQRNAALVANLLDAATVGNRAVLVAGGFHTRGLTEILKEKRISYAVVAPKITRVDSGAGSAYLSVFDREKTPLETMFSGKKLFVAAQVAGAAQNLLPDAPVATDSILHSAVSLIADAAGQGPELDRALLAANRAGLDETIVAVDRDAGSTRITSRTPAGRLVTRVAAAAAGASARFWERVVFAKQIGVRSVQVVDSVFSWPSRAWARASLRGKIQMATVALALASVGKMAFGWSTPWSWILGTFALGMTVTLANSSSEPGDGPQLASLWKDLVKSGKVKNVVTDADGNEIEVGVRLAGDSYEFYGTTIEGQPVERKVELKPVGGRFEALRNEYRLLKPGHSATMSDLPLHDPATCSACTGPRSFKARRESGAILTTTEVNGRTYEVHYNIAPLVPEGHVLFIPDSADPANARPQRLTDSDVEDFLALAPGEEDFIKLYQSERAGASLNHIHFHGMNLPDPLPVERVPMDTVYAMPHTRIGTLADYPARAIVFASDGTDQGNINLRILLKLAVGRLETTRTPFDLVWRGSSRVYLFIREKEFEITPEFPGAKLGALELLGRFHIESADATSFNEVTADRIASALDRTTFSTEKLLSFIGELTSPEDDIVLSSEERRDRINENLKTMDADELPVAGLFKTYDVRWFNDQTDVPPALIGAMSVALMDLAVDRARADFSDAVADAQPLVIVGRDARASSREDQAAAIDALIAAGAEVIDLGSDDPNHIAEFYFAVNWEFASAGDRRPVVGLFLTASHVQGNVGGIKSAFGSKKGIANLTSDQVATEWPERTRQVIRDGIPQPTFAGSVEPGSVREPYLRSLSIIGGGERVGSENHLLRYYEEAIEGNYAALEADVESESRPLEGLRLLVDTGHAAAGLTAPAIYRQLGAEVDELHTDVQAIGASHIADPSRAEFRNPAINQVQWSDDPYTAALLYDLDGDRGQLNAVIPGTGEYPNENVQALEGDLVGALVAPVLWNAFHEKFKGKEMVVAVDVKSSGALVKVLKDLGFTVIEGKTGYPNLIQAMDDYVAEKPEDRVAVMFIEKSGHLATLLTGMKEDPTVTLLLILQAAAEDERLAQLENRPADQPRGLPALIAQIPPYKSTTDIRPPMSSELLMEDAITFKEASDVAIARLPEVLGVGETIELRDVTDETAALAVRPTVLSTRDRLKIGFMDPDGELIGWANFRFSSNDWTWSIVVDGPEGPWMETLIAHVLNALGSATLADFAAPGYAGRDEALAALAKVAQDAVEPGITPDDTQIAKNDAVERFEQGLQDLMAAEAPAAVRAVLDRLTALLDTIVEQVDGSIGGLGDLAQGTFDQAADIIVPEYSSQTPPALPETQVREGFVIPEGQPDNYVVNTVVHYDLKGLVDPAVRKLPDSVIEAVREALRLAEKEGKINASVAVDIWGEEIRVIVNHNFGLSNASVHALVFDAVREGLAVAESEGLCTSEISNLSRRELAKRVSISAGERGILERKGGESWVVAFGIGVTVGAANIKLMHDFALLGSTPLQKLGASKSPGFRFRVKKMSQMRELGPEPDEFEMEFSLDQFERYTEKDPEVKADKKKLGQMKIGENGMWILKPGKEGRNESLWLLAFGSQPNEYAITDVYPVDGSAIPANEPLATVIYKRVTGPDGGVLMNPTIIYRSQSGANAVGAIQNMVFDVNFVPGGVDGDYYVATSPTTLEDARTRPDDIFEAGIGYFAIIGAQLGKGGKLPGRRFFDVVARHQRSFKPFKDDARSMGKVMASHGDQQPYLSPQAAEQRVHKLRQAMDDLFIDAPSETDIDPFLEPLQKRMQEEGWTRVSDDKADMGGDLGHQGVPLYLVAVYQATLREAMEHGIEGLIPKGAITSGAGYGLLAELERLSNTENRGVGDDGHMVILGERDVYSKLSHQLSFLAFTRGYHYIAATGKKPYGPGQDFQGTEAKKAKESPIRYSHYSEKYFEYLREFLPTDFMEEGDVEMVEAKWKEGKESQLPEPFTGNVTQQGIGSAGYSFNPKEERTFDIVAGDKMGPPAFNLLMQEAIHNAALSGEFPNGLVYEIWDLKAFPPGVTPENATDEQLKNIPTKRIFLDAVEDRELVKKYLADSDRFNVRNVWAKAWPGWNIRNPQPFLDRPLLSSSVTRLGILTGGEYVGKDDPLIIGNSRLMPFVHDWLRKNPLIVQGDMNGSHWEWAVLARLDEAVATIRSLPILTAVRYTVSEDGNRIEGIEDVFADTTYDAIAEQAHRFNKDFDKAQLGQFEPHGTNAATVEGSYELAKILRDMNSAGSVFLIKNRKAWDTRVRAWPTSGAENMGAVYDHVLANKSLLNTILMTVFFGAAELVAAFTLAGDSTSPFFFWTVIALAVPLVLFLVQAVRIAGTRGESASSNGVHPLLKERPDVFVETKSVELIGVIEQDGGYAIGYNEERYGALSYTEQLWFAWHDRFHLAFRALPVPVPGFIEEFIVSLSDLVTFVPASLGFAPPLPAADSVTWSPALLEALPSVPTEFVAEDAPKAMTPVPLSVEGPRSLLDELVGRRGESRLAWLNDAPKARLAFVIFTFALSALAVAAVVGGVAWVVVWLSGLDWSALLGQVDAQITWQNVLKAATVGTFGLAMLVAGNGSGSPAPVNRVVRKALELEKAVAEGRETDPLVTEILADAPDVEAVLGKEFARDVQAAHIRAYLNQVRPLEPSVRLTHWTNLFTYIQRVAEHGSRTFEQALMLVEQRRAQKTAVYVYHVNQLDSEELLKTEFRDVEQLIARGMDNWIANRPTAIVIAVHSPTDEILAGVGEAAVVPFASVVTVDDSMRDADGTYRYESLLKASQANRRLGEIDRLLNHEPNAWFLTFSKLPGQFKAGGFLEKVWRVLVNIGLGWQIVPLNDMIENGEEALQHA